MSDVCYMSTCRQKKGLHFRKQWVFPAFQGRVDQALKKKIVVICPNNNIVNIPFVDSNIWLWI